MERAGGIRMSRHDDESNDRLAAGNPLGCGVPPKRSESHVPIHSRWRNLDGSFWVVGAIYGIAVIWMWWAIHARTGEISYTVDDAYIHGTIARNIADHGSFGIVPGQFAAASSSILWTLLLAAVFSVTGAQPWIPAVLASLFGLLIVERCNSLMKKTGIAPLERTLVLLMVMAYAPVLPIVSTGMEHTLHAWLVVCLFSSLLDVSRGTGTRHGMVFLWALLTAGARYESLFALPPLLLWLAFHRKWRTAFELGCGMALPVLAFAAYSLTHGGYALPNSLMLKGNIAGAWNPRAGRVLMENQYLLMLVVLLAAAALVTVLHRGMRKEKLTWLPVSAAMMIMIHLQLAQLGWFWRYEGYLIVLGLTSAALLLVPLRDWLRGRPPALSLTLYVLLVFATLPLCWRADRAHGEIIHAAGNIHDQQIQMARVTRYLGEGARVAVNDLGAMSYLTEARVLDLYGLGDNALARAKCGHVYGAACLKTRLEETRTDYVIYYPAWFSPPDQLPDTLIPVEKWVLGDNLICGNDTVVFYGTSPQSADRLAAALARFRADGYPDSRSTNQSYPVKRP